jgi:hypothetical protein
MRRRARKAADRAAPIARQAVPIARQASTAARQGGQDAMAWAVPRVDEARSWAAPKLERTGIAVRDNIAPKISDALVTAAHRLDAKPPRKRRWPRLLIGLALLTAIASVAAAILRRRKPGPAVQQPPSQAAADSTVAPAAQEPDRTAEANGKADAEASRQYLGS